MGQRLTATSVSLVSLIQLLVTSRVVIVFLLLDLVAFAKLIGSEFDSLKCTIRQATHQKHVCHIAAGVAKEVLCEIHHFFSGGYAETQSNGTADDHAECGDDLFGADVLEGARYR